MTEVEAIRQRIETLADRWRAHPDRIPADVACEQLLAALDGPSPTTPTNGAAK